MTNTTEAARALRDAAEQIRREAGADECAMHDVADESQLPEYSRYMLNGVTRAAERMREKADALEAAPAPVEFKIVAHQISKGTEGITARLVLQDEEGFYRAFLAVGEPAETFWGATEDAVRAYESKLRAIEVA